MTGNSQSTTSDRTERRVLVADDDVLLREGIAGVVRSFMRSTPSAQALVKLWSDDVTRSKEPTVASA